MTVGAVSVGAIPSVPAPGGEGREHNHTDFWTHMHNVSPGSLLFHWPINELEGSTVWDHSGNGYHGSFASSTGQGLTIGPDGNAAYSGSWINMVGGQGSTTLSDAWPNTFSLAIWLKPTSTSQYISGAFDNALGYIASEPLVDSVSVLYFRGELADNEIGGQYWPKGDGVSAGDLVQWNVSDVNFDTDQWFMIGVQNDTATSVLRIWINDMKYLETAGGSTGMWGGGLADTQASLGALWSQDSDGGGGGGQQGSWSMSNCIMWNSFLDTDQMASLGSWFKPKYVGEGYFLYDQFADVDSDVQLDTSTDGHYPDKYPQPPSTSVKARWTGDTGWQINEGGWAETDSDLTNEASMIYVDLGSTFAGWETGVTVNTQHWAPENVQAYIMAVEDTANRYRFGFSPAIGGQEFVFHSAIADAISTDWTDSLEISTAGGDSEHTLMLRGQTKGMISAWFDGVQMHAQHDSGTLDSMTGFGIGANHGALNDPTKFTEFYMKEYSDSNDDFTVVDYFTDTDGTPLDISSDGHFPDKGPRWAVESGTVFDCTGGVASMQSGAGGGIGYVWTGGGSSDLTLEADLTLGASGVYSGVVFNLQDSANALEFFVQTGVGTFFGNNVAGVRTTLNTGVAALSSGVTYALRVENDGSTIDLYIDDILVYSTNDTEAIVGTNYGLFQYDTPVTAKWDNFIVGTDTGPLGDGEYLWIHETFTDSVAFIDASVLDKQRIAGSDGAWNIASTSASTDQWESSNGRLHAAGGQSGYGAPMINLGSTVTELYYSYNITLNSVNAGWPYMIIGTSDGWAGTYFAFQQHHHGSEILWISSGGGLSTADWPSSNGDELYMEIHKNDQIWTGYIEDINDTTVNQSIVIDDSGDWADYTWFGLGIRPTFGEGAADWFDNVKIANYSTK